MYATLEHPGRRAVRRRLGIACVGLAASVALAIGCARVVPFGGPDLGEPDLGDAQAAEQRPREGSTAETTAVWTLVDSTRADFERGSYGEGTRWRDDHVELVGPPYAAAGEFRSRIFDTADSRTRWTALRWTPGAPSLKPLPDGAQSETGYAAGAFSMAQNVLLYHLDGDGSESLLDAGHIADTSGRAHHATVANADGAGSLYVGGVLRRAARLEKADYLRVTDTSTSGDFDFGTGDFTWALWAKPEPCDGNNRVYLGGQRGADPRADPHVWLGGTCGGWCNGKDGAAAVLVDRAGRRQIVCAPSVLGTIAWHHLVLRKMGHGSHNVALFVDGVKYDFASGSYSPTADDTFTGDFDFTGGNGELRIGGFLYAANDLYPTAVTVDEVAIWKRALGDEEVRALHRRAHALRLRFQLRACPDGSCDSEPFLGPDGTALTYFTEETNSSLGPPAATDNLVALPLSGALLQYRALLESANPVESPVLLNVTLEGRLP